MELRQRRQKHRSGITTRTIPLENWTERVYNISSYGYIASVGDHTIYRVALGD